jgi:hypothetical protein
MRILSLTLTSLLLTIAIEAQTQGTAYESKTLTSNILKMDRKFSVYLPVMNLLTLFNKIKYII